MYFRDLRIRDVLILLCTSEKISLILTFFLAQLKIVCGLKIQTQAVRWSSTYLHIILYSLIGAAAVTP